ncbi:MAG: hypothetical protein COA79_01750 [Planctomycetota bacterium]|nr:MAG: hypothetical protein COA79_01750 [Planctomycetota bacterium]
MINFKYVFMKILIVDDEVNITEALKAYLSEKHDVICFNDPLTALSHYSENNEYSVIITDFLMPNLRGDEMIEKMFDQNPSQSFIVISGFFTKQLTDVLKKSNAYIKMIDKPIEPKELELSLDSISKIQSC